jgi:hypothetical protein
LQNSPISVAYFWDNRFSHALRHGVKHSKRWTAETFAALLQCVRMFGCVDQAVNAWSEVGAASVLGDAAVHSNQCMRGSTRLEFIEIHFYVSGRLRVR